MKKKTAQFKDTYTKLFDNCVLSEPYHFIVLHVFFPVIGKMTKLIHVIAILLNKIKEIDKQFMHLLKLNFT